MNKKYALRQITEAAYQTESKLYDGMGDTRVSNIADEQKVCLKTQYWNKKHISKNRETLTRTPWSCN